MFLKDFSTHIKDKSKVICEPAGLYCTNDNNTEWNRHNLVIVTTIVPDIVPDIV